MLVGETIGQYRVTGLIGQGGMGAVYAAEHTLLGRPAAIKVLLPELSQKQDVVMRFFNEARAATAIRHPGIVEIYDFGWTPDGAAFIVMEHLQGETLADRSARTRLRWKSALAIGRQISGALSAAHGKGIVHRDLKPDNIFLVPDPEVPGGERIKLLDFGIAKLAGESTTGVNVTKTGAVMGTPTYMSPEQCRGVAVDHRADLYALGCILFELCSGRPPFVGEGTGDVLAAHIHVPVPALASFGVELPPPVEALIQRLLAKSPGQRMQTAEAVIQAIDVLSPERSTSGLGLGLGLGAPGARSAAASAPDLTTLSGAASTKTRMPAPRRRIALIAGAMVLGGIVVVVLATRGGNDSKVVSYQALPRGSGQELATPDAAAVAPGAPPVATVAAVAAVAADAAVPPDAAVASDAAVPPDAAVVPDAAVAPDAAIVARVAPDADVSAPATPAAPASGNVASKTNPASPGRAEPALRPASPAPPAGHAPAPPSDGWQPPGDDIAIDSTPPGAQILLNGTLLGKTPFHGVLHRTADATLVVHLAGYADTSVMFHAGQALTKRLDLAKVAAPKKNRDRSVNPFGD